MARISSATGLILLAALLLVGGAADAQSRTENLRWLHADPTNTAGYKVYFGDAPRSYTQQLDVGVPTLLVDTFTVDVQVPDNGAVYFAVTSYDASGNESVYSNEIVRGTPTDGGGDSGGDGGSDPPVGGGTAQSAITGFKLVHPITDAVIDGDFRSGDSVDIAVHGCLAIEVQVNSYLQQWNSPGSVKMIFDGQNQACTVAPLSHENNPPFAWESENDCAESMNAVGAHQLVAIPYDGDDCTGEQGTQATVIFEVIQSGGGDGSDLGQPGRPFLLD